MLAQSLTKLRDFILKYNTYFDSGFDNAVKDDSTGQVNDGTKIIFPADNLGAYFYLRLPKQLQADYSREYIISDPANSIGVKNDVILVAYYPGGDNAKLLENIITTIGRYNDEPLKITKMIYQTDSILFQELSGISKDDLKSALQQFPEDSAICCVHFTFTIPFVFQNLNCIQKPCKDC